MVKTTDNEDTAAKKNDSTTQLPAAVWEFTCVGLVVLTLWLSIGAAAAPTGPVFALECVFVAGVLGGRLVSLIAKKSEVPRIKRQKKEHKREHAPAQARNA